MTDFEDKVIGLLETINEKLDKLLSEGGGAAPKPAVAAENDAYVKPSDLVAKQQEAARQEVKPTVEGRRICPDCGGTAFNTVEDKSQILHQQGGLKIYAKKYICKKCGKEVF